MRISDLSSYVCSSYLRGNVTKLLLILAFFAILHLLYVYFNYAGYPMVSTALSLLNSFLVGPLSSVVVSMVYRSMLADYRGGDDPDVMKNVLRSEERRVGQVCVITGRSRWSQYN